MLEGGETMEPFQSGGYWFVKIDGRLIKCESYEAAWDLLEGR